MQLQTSTVEDATSLRTQRYSGIHHASPPEPKELENSQHQMGKPCSHEHAANWVQEVDGFCECLETCTGHRIFNTTHETHVRNSRNARAGSTDSESSPNLAKKCQPWICRVGRNFGHCGLSVGSCHFSPRTSTALQISN